MRSAADQTGLREWAWAVLLVGYRNHVADVFVDAKELDPLLSQLVNRRPLFVPDEVLLDEEAKVFLHLSIGQVGAVHDSRLCGTVDGRLENHRDYVGPAPVFHAEL